MAGAIKLDIRIDGATALKRAIRVLQEPDAPFIRDALTESGQLLQSAASARAPGRIGRSVEFAGVKGSAASIRAVVAIKHPAARSMEFGRHFYYAGFAGNNRPGSKRAKGSIRKTGNRVWRQGQKARPFLGVKDGGGALDAIRPRVEELLARAFEREWDRLTSGGAK